LGLQNTNNNKLAIQKTGTECNPVKNKFKYGQLTDKIYKSIFKENAKEYRMVLDLKAKDNVRMTMYSEVLDLIASFENGFAHHIKEKYQQNGEPFTLSEAHETFAEYEKLTEKIYIKMK